jgi:hypothetical protein
LESPVEGLAEESGDVILPSAAGGGGARAIRGVNDEDLEVVIEDDSRRPVIVEVMARIRETSSTEIPSADGLDAAAASLHQDRGKFWVGWLNSSGHKATFVTALLARGVDVGGWTMPVAHVKFPPDKWAEFAQQSEAFRCIVHVNGSFKGSGVLVGPSSVLTAWHVIAVASPDQPQSPVPRIEVEFADGRRVSAVVHPASSPGDVPFAVERDQVTAPHS